MKFKYYIKLFKKTKIKKKIINGTLIIGKKIESVYLMRNNYTEKIFSNNFVKIKYLNKKFDANINHIKYHHINNIIKQFVIICLPTKYIKIKIENNYSFLKKKILIKNFYLYPKKILFNINKCKKILRLRDFNLSLSKKIIFFKKELTNSNFIN